MTDRDVCLTPDEVAALRQIFAMLATIGERGFRDDKHLCQISAEIWRDYLVVPAQRLRRITTRRLDEGSVR